MASAFFLPGTYGHSEAAVSRFHPSLFPVSERCTHSRVPFKKFLIAQLLTSNLHRCALQFKDMKCDSIYISTNERQCYRLASCIAQPSNANIITILVFFLLHFVFFSSAEWVYYFTFASSFVFVECLLKFDTDSELPDFGKQDPALLNEDPDELFFQERAEE